MTVAVDKDRIDWLKKILVMCLGKSWVNNTKTMAKLLPQTIDKRAWLVKCLTRHIEEGWLDEKQAKLIKKEWESNPSEFNKIFDECLE